MEFCFLLSSERSGSNLITRLMDGHSRVCGPSPTHLFRILLEHRARYGDLTEPGNWRALVADTVALADTKLGEWSSSISEMELLDNVEAGSLGALLRYVYEKEAAAEGKDLLFVKENHFYRHFAFVDRYFPVCKFIFLVRDPRDMALSWKRALNLRGCVIRAAETWKGDQSANLALYQALADQGRIVGLRYEDLVTNTDECLRKATALLGIDFEKAMVRLDERPGNWANASSTEEWANLRKPVMRDNFKKYPGALSVPEIQFVEGVCANEMQALGYRPDYAERASLTELRAAIQPLELYEKPHYSSQPDDVKERHARRVAVLRAMRGRQAGPVWT